MAKAIAMSMAEEEQRKKQVKIFPLLKNKPFHSRQKACSSRSQCLLRHIVQQRRLLSTMNPIPTALKWLRLILPISQTTIVLPPLLLLIPTTMPWTLCLQLRVTQGPRDQIQFLERDRILIFWCKSNESLVLKDLKTLTWFTGVRELRPKDRIPASARDRWVLPKVHKQGRESLQLDLGTLPKKPLDYIFSF